MNINDLPLEILEKIIFEGRFCVISNVCQVWRKCAQNYRSKFNDVYFDTAKDDPKNVKNKNPTDVFLYNSQEFNKKSVNSIRVHSDFRFGFDNIKNLFFYNHIKIINFISNFSSISSLNIIFNPLLNFKDFSYLKYYDYCLSKPLKRENINVQEIFIDFLLANSPYFNKLMVLINIKTNNLNIKIKDFCDKLENIYYFHFFNIEISNLSELINNLLFIKFEKFTYNGPNSTYIIYDQNEKILIIRYGNYKKYKFSYEKIIGYHHLGGQMVGKYYYYTHKTIPICRVCCKDDSICKNKLHYKYIVNCFKNHYYHRNIRNFYPAILILDDYDKLFSIGQIEKLVIISNDFYQFVFDKLLDTSKLIQKEKIIQYHCLNQNKKTFIQNNFAFLAIDKKQENNYSFNQMYFNLYKRNVY